MSLLTFLVYDKARRENLKIEMESENKEPRIGLLEIAKNQDLIQHQDTALRYR